MPERGEVWLAALDPAAAGEQGGTRPVLVVSTKEHLFRRRDGTD